MQQDIEIIPLLLLKGRSAMFREFSKKQLSALSKNLRKMNFEKLYIMDIDGLERNRPQLDIVQVLCDDFSILYEAGPRRGANIIDMVIAGAEIAYMNTDSLEALDEIEIALSYTESVGLKIDWNNGMLGHGKGIENHSMDEVISSAVSAGLKDFVVPIEIIAQAAIAMKDDSVVLRGIADRSGDEKIRNERMSSIIINHEYIKKVKK
ncbi:MAG: hypothetical protein OEV21_01015 [Thermoplasmata archaeon]|nr:hypothetical protein [Thermoplasmata archaeon]